MTSFSDLGKGKAWEYRVHRAMFLSGMYVRRGVNLRERVGGSPQTLAEVDIFGIGFDPLLRPALVVGECKDRKGGAKEADRITWLLGLSSMLGADHVLFAKTSLSEGTLVFARAHDLLLWDEAAVSSIERAVGMTGPDDFFGGWNIGLCEDILTPSRRSSALRETPLRGAYDYLSGAYWYSANATRVKRLRGYFKAIERTDGLEQRVRSGFVTEGVLALLVAAFTTAGELKRGSPARAERRQADLFASGIADVHELKELAARADDYYQDALRKVAESARDASRAYQVPRLAREITEPPSWLRNYLDFSWQLGQRPRVAVDALRYADLRLLEGHVAGREVDTVVQRLFSQEHELLRPLQLAAVFLLRTWGVEDPVLEAVLQRHAPAREARAQQDGGGVSTRAEAVQQLPLE